VLVTSERSADQTRQYFANKGFDVFVPYGEMIKTEPETIPSQPVG
jgi:hypothetical protein